MRMTMALRKPATGTVEAQLISVSFFSSNYLSCVGVGFGVRCVGILRRQPDDADVGVGSMKFDPRHLPRYRHVRIRLGGARRRFDDRRDIDWRRDEGHSFISFSRQ